jgi:hypothetical protein
MMLRETIKQLTETLDPRKFVRVHRSAIVNIGHVREILREGRSEGWVLLSNGHRLKMSKSWLARIAGRRPPRIEITHSASLRTQPARSFPCIIYPLPCGTGLFPCKPITSNFG